jgi:hypothetical protein
MHKTKTLRPIYKHEQPADRIRDATYYNPKVKEKIKDGIKTFRVRGTAGGDKINYPGAVAANTASLDVVKCLTNSVISTDGAKFMTLDISDFYLHTDLTRPEYIKVDVKHIPFLTERFADLLPYVQKGKSGDGFVLFECTKGMYGLPQAGLLSQITLTAHLVSHGYREDPQVPCLFRHLSNGVTFSLVVDDFGVKYTSRDGAQHLINTLQEKYPVTIDWDGKKYLGITFDWDYDNHTVELSMPGYVDKQLKRFCPNGIRGCLSPSLYIPPLYGKRQQYVKPLGPTISEPEITRVREIVGVFLYYARAVDYSMLPAVCAIASEQSNGSQDLLKMTERLLGYASSHRNLSIKYHRSNMIVEGVSDCSYLSRSKARSVAGGIGYCGDDNNGLLFAYSNIIDVVVSSAFEGEYAATYTLARYLTHIVDILTALGHSQPTPTLILCDNRVAVGITKDEMKLKTTKCIDMRFHWIRDRVRQKQFSVTWYPGKTNKADFFTKAVAPPHHQIVLRTILSPHKFLPHGQ